jgi:DNA-binding NarL/FixJ family response regulator
MKVLVADDHPLMVEGVREALAGEGIEVAGVATDGTQVLPMTNRLRPDLVLLDLSMPLMDGLTCLQQLRQRFPEIKVVILSAFSDPERIEVVLRAGASGYIVKGVESRDLAAALRQMLEGTVYMAIGVPERRERAGGAAGLTTRELEILDLVAQGLSNGRIAKQLWVTVTTVKFHLTSVYRKLEVSNRTEAARAAHRLGLVQSPALDAVPAA